jgi:Tfp pilus assembly protein PilV
MRTRAREEDGFLMIELVAASLVMTVALLALIGAYSMGFFAIGSAGTTSSAGLLANNQLELYSTLPYSSIGLDSTSLSSAKSSDATYSTDEAALPLGGATGDVTVSSGCASAQCLAVQTVTGADHKTYKVETFIRLLSTGRGDGSTRPEKIVSVDVRNMSASGNPIAAKMQTAFDAGSPQTSAPAILTCSQIGVKCESELMDPTIVDSNTIEIVYSDDQAPRGGSFIPTAYLNSAQQLGIGISTTSGWPQNYVDTYGGSASTNNQELLTIQLPTGLAPACYTVLVTTSDNDGPDTDQWAWPITVASDGTLTTVAHC